ncbi:MAG: hypothetical protein JST32_12795 [Bacteroidetes bacterium]|nr:hypothetical protein [Bacteroidota bacterium]
MSTFLINPTEDQEKIVKAFLEALEISFVKSDGKEELPEHVIKGIQEGMEDFEAGCFITLEEFKKKTAIF